MAAHLHRTYHAALINGIDADRVGAKVTNVEQAIVRGDDPTCGLVSDQVAATHFIVARLDDRKIVTAEVADK